ncbi:MAG: carbohydrate binding domain-containing protein, partial [Acutalibacteraceae bacterium]|nr:carbohydrate binding domain-containing protein [Acutalibacteraceae bacterium]
MRKIAKRACATLLASTILTSMFSFSSISAAATEVKTQAGTQSDKQSQSQSEAESPDGEFRRATGDRSLEDGEYSEGVEIISSPEEYLSIVNGGASTYSEDPQGSVTLPESYDNSTGGNQKYFPPIGDQGNIGSCACWAQVYYQFSYAVHRELDRIGTYQNSFSPKFIYNMANGGEDEGSAEGMVYEYLMENGAPSMDTLRYDDNWSSWNFSEKVWTEAAKYKVKSYQYIELPNNPLFVTSADDSDLDTMKAALANGDILAYSTYVYSWKYSNLKSNPDAPENSKFVNEYVVTYMDGAEGPHRMAIVGYNDNIWTDINNNNQVDNGEMGAFKIVNSWGTNYKNDGFAWVAYDALNAVSSVKGAPIAVRNRIFQEITRIDVETSNATSNIFLKYTVNSATRARTPIEIVADKYNTETVDYLVPYNTWANLSWGPDDMSYQGTSVASDATFYADLTAYFPEINSDNISDYSISVRFEDREADSKPLTVKNIEIVDKNNNKVYKPSNFSQFTLDGAKKTVDVLNCTEKVAKIYYNGYQNPNIEYKTQNGNWVSAPGYAMEQTADILGYTHKYVIHLDDAESSALVRFNDGNGTYDNNGGSYYTALEGSNLYKTSGVSVPELKLTYTTNLPDDGVVDLRRVIYFDLDAQGGFAPYTYRKVITNLDTGAKSQTDYDEIYKMNVESFSVAGNYALTYIVRDQSGKEASVTVNLTTKDLTPKAEYFTTYPATDIYVGEPCYFEALITNDIHEYDVSEYKIEIYNFDRGFFYPALDIKRIGLRYRNFELHEALIATTWTPEVSGNYIAYLTVKDRYGNYGYSSFGFNVTKKPLTIDSFTVSPESKGGFFEIADMKAKASGGTGTLQYQFSYWRMGTEYVIQDYSTDNTASYQFGIDTGNYDLIVRVKDSAGTVATEKKTFTVLQTYVKDLTFDKASASVGENIVITPTINNDSSVLKAEHYKYTVTKDGKTETLKTSADETATWTPTEAGTYKVQLEIRYNDTLVAILSKDYEVAAEQLIAYLEVSPDRQAGIFEKIKLTANATGGTGNYEYKFYYRKDGSEYVIRDFDASNTVDVYYGNLAGYYDFFVTVKDSKGNTSTTQQLFILRNTYISKLEFSSDTTNVGKTVKITPTLEYEASVIEAEHYKYTVTKDGVIQTLTTSSDKTARWTPTEAGTYTVKLDVRYQGVLIASRSVEYTVNPALSIDSFKLSQTEGGLYETIDMTANATGGTGTLEYKFAYTVNYDEYIVQDYSTDNTASIQLGKNMGVYHFTVTVKDSAGNTATKEEVFVQNYTYIGDITFSKSTANTGETIVITPTVYHESSVFKPEHYIYTVTKDGVTQSVKTLSDKTASWTPTEAGTYTVKLQLKYGDSYSYEKTKNITITQAPADNKIYFIPSDNWKEANARFAVYAWNGSENEWATLTEADGVYVAELNNNYTNVIFCRLNPSTTGNNWNNTWNQTADLVKPENKNCFTINKGEWTGANGTWSEYVPVTKGVSVVGDIQLALEETDDNIYTGVVELQAGTYKFNVDHNGTTLGMNYTYTDTATIDYSAGYKAATTLNVSGGRYTFTYNATSKKLTIKFKSFDDIVELFGDINAELVRPNK